MSYDAIADELERWFFDGYFKTWVAIGRSERPAEDILDYWNVPMFAASVFGQGMLTDMEAVTGLLNTTHAPLKAGGYSHTKTLDWQLTLYNEVSGCLDAIWSRRAADETEIHRIATHFDVRKLEQGWRIVGLSNDRTEAETLDALWHRRRMPR
ncbi:MAG: hypothetical protein OIF47_17530 [Marinibacterium sp.]|nr:hypothetical protein [Marinibacterium sp.]